MNLLLTKLALLLHPTIILSSLPLAAAYFYLAKFRPKWKNFVYLPLLFLTIRVLFLQNPLSWSFYRRLTVDDVGWRQKDEIHSKFEHYLSPKPVEYLAVGSSQTGAVYEPYAKQHDHLRVLSFAGMGTSRPTLLSAIYLS